MSCKIIRPILFAAVALLARSAVAVTIPTVPVGNPGNLADTRYIDSYHPSGVGSVGYSFNIGKTEVTNAQYVEFLNAVADADPYGLYNTNMDSWTGGGIVRSGTSGSYLYAVKAPALSGAYIYDDKPVVYVSAGDALRFANWLHNNQPSGAQDATTTEDGAYTLNGATGQPDVTAVTRNAGARWWLPNEDEWYKAAYHKNDGDTGNYWNYPTSNDLVPSNAGDSGNSANWYDNGLTTGDVDHPLTNAGSFTLSDSPYGTFDQAGNVSEWNETPFSLYSRGIRGGSWYYNAIPLHASYWGQGDSLFEGIELGFRVASIPEPATMWLGALATVVMWLCRKGRS
jgi:formylglycine-generating enzyme required for sulfatase activity